MHGFPVWFLWVLWYWPLILGITLGAIGQIVWWWVQR